MATPEQEEANRRAQEDLERRQLMAAFDLGLRVRQFLDGDLGKRMLRDSSEEKDDIKNALVAADEGTDEGRKEIRELRMRFYALNQWQVFFDQYIREGDAAESQLRELDGDVFPHEGE